jgi:sugar O-acyltransferase (sialic acid O-acetyltransferase NeuD family)
LDPIKVVIIGAKNPETARMMSAINDAEAAETGVHRVFHGFIDNDPRRQGTVFCGLPVFGGLQVLDMLIEQGCVFVNTITGTTLARYETSREVRARGGRLVNFIHPTAGRPERIGTGNYIQEHVLMQAGVTIGDNSSIHFGAVISHESRIGSSTFVAHRVSVSGEVVIGDGVFIGTNATVLPRIAIGNWATIGAGAVVLNDVPPYAVMVGNPARVLRINEARYADGALE